MFHHFRAEGTEAQLDFDIELEPGKSVYCFLGKNGAGKTSLLENLGRTLLLAHTMFAERTPDGSNGSEAAGEMLPSRAAGPQQFAGIFGLADVHSKLAGITLRVPREAHLDAVRVKTALESFGVIDLQNWAGGASFITALGRGTPSSNPVPENILVVDYPVVAIGARDRGFTENVASDLVRLLGNRASRFVDAYLRSYGVVTRQRAEPESLADWFVARLVINPKFARTDDRSFEVETVLRLMELLDPDAFGGITAKDPEGNLLHVHYADGKLWLGKTPFDKLPSGYISILKIFQEILGGYAGWTAFNDTRDLANVEGIVLIDEIEAHLHPMWQAKVLPLLKRFFPKTTFYVCTHSPLIAATTDEGEAYELVRDSHRVTARKLGNPRAWYLADVYEQAFHVELPSSDGGPSVPDLLLDFSVKVKEHLRTRDTTLRSEAHALYERIVPSLPATDPRRASLDALKGMLG